MHRGARTTDEFGRADVAGGAEDEVGEERADIWRHIKSAIRNLWILSLARADYRAHMALERREKKYI